MRWIAGTAILCVALLLWLLMSDRTADRRTTRGPAGTRPGAAATTPASGPDAAGADQGAEAALAGRVVDDGTDEPIHGARVELRALMAVPDSPWFEAPPAAPPVEPLAVARTGAEGDFALPIGRTALLRVVADGYLPWLARVSPGDEPRVRLARGVERTYRVVDLDGRPVEGALARVYRSGDSWWRAWAYSNASGEVTLVLGERDAVFVSAAGYTTTKGRGSTVVLRPGAAVEGVVVNRAGEPIAGACLALESVGLNEVGRTDAEGRFGFRGLDPELESLLWIEHPDYFGQETVVPGSVDVRIELAALGPEPVPVSVEGIVEDPDGRAVPGARVVCNGYQRETADDDGRFTVSAEPGRTCTLFATAGTVPALPGEKNPPPALRGVLRFEPPAPFVRVRLEAVPRSYARLRILDSDGEPVWGAGVRGGRTGRDSDRQGCLLVAIEAVPGSRAPLWITGTGSSWRCEVTTHAHPDCPEQVVAPPRGPRRPRADLYVRLPDGSPLPATLDAEVDLYPTQGVRLSGTERHDGFTFEFDPEALRVLGGRLDVRVTAPGFPERHIRPRQPEDGGIVAVRLEPGVVLTGRLVDADGGGIPFGGWARAVALDSGIHWEERHAYWVQAGCDRDDGSFELPVAPAGRLRVLAGREGSGPLWQLDLAADPGTRRDLGSIEVPPRESVEGRVLDASGRPLSGVRIRTLGEHQHWTVTHADGSFTLPMAEWAEVGVYARKAGHGTVCVPLHEARRIVMPTPGRVRLTIDHASGSPFVGWALYAARPDSAWLWKPGQQYADEDDICLCFDLPPGPLEFHAKTPWGVPLGRQRVDVVPGETVEATLRLP